MKRFSISLLSLGLSLCLLAQAPQKIKYQSIVRDNTGAVIVNTAVSFRISVLQGNENGPSVYTETHTGQVTNAFGLVNLEIGGGSVESGDLSAITWGTDNYFFNIELDATGGTNYQQMGTSQALSVPYALNARTADAVANAPWVGNGDAIYNTNSGNVGVGTNAPYGKFQVETANSSFRVYGFEPADAVELTGEFRGLTAQPALRFASENTGEFWDIGMNGADGYRIASANGEAVAITPELNLGVGTIAPENKLSVESAAAGNAVGIRNTNNLGAAAIAFSDDAAEEQLWVGYDNTGGGSPFPGVASINSRPALVLATQNAERMRITQTGEVGIGTATPQAQLDVTGNVRIADGTQGQDKVLTSDANGLATWQSSAAHAYGVIDGVNFTVNAGSYNVESVSHTSTGNFEVVLSTSAINGMNAPIACALVDTNFYGFISYYQSLSNVVYVRIRDASGADADASFSLVVFGNP